MTEDDARELLREANEAIAKVSRMIEENRKTQRYLAAEAEERARRHAEIEAQHARTDELLDRLNRLLVPSPEPGHDEQGRFSAPQAASRG